MKKHHATNHTQLIIKIIEITLIFFWLITLKESDSLYIPYLIAGISSIFCCAHRQFIKPQKHLALSAIFASIFTFFICSANYSLFPAFSTPSNFILDIITLLSLIAGSFITFYNIFIYLPLAITNISLKNSKNHTKFYQYKPRTIFLVSFSAIAIIYLLVFFLCKYPGNLSPDSIRQVTQNLTGEYKNWHPFSHTILIGFFVNLGQNLFGNLNAGVALYSVFQILFTSSVFAYSLTTLYQRKCPKAILMSILLFYILCPYHIMYSMTMWKDIIFSLSILLFVISQYRIFQSIGSNWANYVTLTIGSLNICLFRNNGIYVMVILLVLFAVCFLRKNIRSKKVLLNSSIIIVAILFSFIYNKFLLPAWNVAPAELIESLSVPTQQIARTIRDNTINAEQLNLLSNVIDVNRATEEYVPYIADPIKKQIWHDQAKSSYLQNHKSELFKLYLDLGLNHPLSYYQAWADLTRGYYNGGYIYWTLTNNVEPNNLGIERLREQSVPNKLFDSYLSLFENNPVLHIIYCIGFATWITIILLFIAVTKKNKMLSILIAPPLIVIASLLLAAPVFSEFRYAYSVFCCLPFLATIVLLPPLHQSNSKP